MQLINIKLANMADMPSDNTVHAWVALHRTHRRLIDKVAAELKHNGLPPLDWYDVLLELRRAGEQGLRQFEIGDRILLSKHNLSRLIDRLEKKAMVVRESCEEDGRGNRIRITAQGERCVEQSWPVYGPAIQREFGEKLTHEECNEIARLLGKLLET